MYSATSWSIILSINGDSVILCEFKLPQFKPSTWTDLVGATLAADPAPLTADPTPESAAVASEVRDLSGLSAEKLGDIFPIERESYQRWISGKQQSPSEGEPRETSCAAPTIPAQSLTASSRRRPGYSVRSWRARCRALLTTCSGQATCRPRGERSPRCQAGSQRHTRRASDGSQAVVIEGSGG